MREIPEALGKFSSREVFLLNYIRDLEKRIAGLEAWIRSHGQDSPLCPICGGIDLHATDCAMRWASLSDA